MGTSGELKMSPSRTRSLFILLACARIAGSSVVGVLQRQHAALGCGESQWHGFHRGFLRHRQHLRTGEERVLTRTFLSCLLELGLCRGMEAAHW